MEKSLLKDEKAEEPAEGGTQKPEKAHCNTVVLNTAERAKKRKGAKRQRLRSTF